MNKKSLLFLLLPLLLLTLAVVLVSCGGGDSTDPGESLPASSSSTAASEAPASSVAESTSLPEETTEPPVTEAEPEFVSAIFGGGPLVTERVSAQRAVEAGFDTIILWSLHIEENGDMVFNDKKSSSTGSSPHRRRPFISSRSGASTERPKPSNGLKSRSAAGAARISNTFAISSGKKARARTARFTRIYSL